jgi:soluble P-type ATPase
VGPWEIRTVVTDYTGTLSYAGRLVPGIREVLLGLLRLVDLHVVTSDTFGTASAELEGVLAPHILGEGEHDVEKERYVRRFDLRRVAAFGNGRNDRLLLQAVKEGGGLAIAVDNGEGCALETLVSAEVFVAGAVNAFGLLLDPTRLQATLRR